MNRRATAHAAAPGRLFGGGCTPLFDVLQAFLRLQILQQRFINRDRLQRIAEDFGQAVDIVFAFDIVTNGWNVRLICQDALAFSDST